MKTTVNKKTIPLSKKRFNEGDVLVCWLKGGSYGDLFTVLEDFGGLTLHCHKTGELCIVNNREDYDYAYKDEENAEQCNGIAPIPDFTKLTQSELLNWLKWAQYGLDLYTRKPKICKSKAEHEGMLAKFRGEIDEINKLLAV
jgi:hypothetical protein